jgi:hypothetical protein
MNDIEDRLHAMLTRDADAVAGQTDSPAEWRELTDRLDAADRSRSRLRWGGLAAVAAVAAAAVVVAVVTTGRPTADVPPAGPSSTPSEWSNSAEILGKPALDVPGWAAGITPLQAPRRFVRWAQSECTTACVAGADKKLALLFPYTPYDDVAGGSGEILSTDAYIASLDALRSRSVLQVSEWSEVPTLNAGTAKVVVLQPSADQPAVLGCEQLADSIGGCRGLTANTRNVIAVIDAGSAPMVVWLSERGDTDAAAQDAEMVEILGSLRLTGVPISCRELLGSAVLESDCFAQMRARIMADTALHARGTGTGNVTFADYEAAIVPLVEDLKAVEGFTTHTFAIDDPAPLPSDPSTSTEPRVTTWTMSGSDTTTYVCFDGPAVEVSTKDCR